MRTLSSICCRIVRLLEGGEVEMLFIYSGLLLLLFIFTSCFFNIHSYSVFSDLYIRVLVFWAIIDVKWTGKYEYR